ncbi:MAG: cyclic nucleotide-binding domain-containing protein [Acidobacteria bacterium]|nr:cyclic nucleotide-binding domain-containing protein [Acidobacteriota bacterium]
MLESRLRGLPFFEGVETARLQRLEALTETLSRQPHAIVYRTGDACDGLYVVHRGAVLFRAERPGPPVERLRELGAGEIFGEKEALDGTPREAHRALAGRDGPPAHPAGAPARAAGRAAVFGDRPAHAGDPPPQRPGAGLGWRRRLRSRRRSCRAAR